MSRWLYCGLALLLLAALCVPGLAVDNRSTQKKGGEPEWPQWRGPNRDGLSTETGLLERWPQDGPPLAWKSTGLGEGFSSVSIADGRIFSMGDREGAQRVIALNQADGKELWTAEVGAPRTKSYNGPRCTPTVDGKFVYAISTEGNLVCLQTASGKEVWRVSFPQDFKGKMHSGWGFSESPLVDGNQVVCTPGGPEAGVVALDKKNGHVIWRCEIPKLGDKGGDGAAYSSLVIGRGAGVRQYVTLSGRGAVGVSDKGKFLWGYNRVANKTAIIPTALVHDDYVFCSSGYGDGGAALLMLKGAGGQVEAEEVYYLDAKELQNHHGGMILLGNYVYMGHGHNNGFPTCVELKTGKVVWGKQRGPGSGSAAITYADGNLYFRYQNGLMALIRATPEGYEERGTFKIPDSTQPSWPHPVICGGKLYLREQDALLCYNIKK